MRLRLLTESQGPCRIIRYNPDASDEDDDGYFGYLDQAADIADESGIRIDRNKDLAFLAVTSDGGTVIGAVWHSLTQSDDGMVYSFDIAVAERFRAGGYAGIKLISAAVAEYREIASDMPAQIGLYVINPRLASVLEKRFGFTVDAEYEHGAVSMSFYG